VLLPELVQRYLGSGGTVDYEVQVIGNTTPAPVIYQSDPNRRKPLGPDADASIGLFELRYDRNFRPWRTSQLREMPAEAGLRDRMPRPGGGPGPEFGRWQMYVRHRAGSLEAVVSEARRRNLAVTAGVLLLMMASVFALIRTTRQAQRLAGLQMDFVAGVSHELRTPLTVIHTAAYNLHNRVANNPAQVERYGTLIQQESARLKDLVEQILRFASAKAGQVIRQTRPLSVQAVIEEAVRASKGVTEQFRSTVETAVEPGLPPLLGDPDALTHALQNLVSNAAKHGAKTGNWIGVFASKIGAGEEPVVEIRVADHGPGIPPDELERIFDPFFRGKRALEDQIHGTGLGLSLAKEVVEAHGGTIFVHSEPSRGTEFVIHIPAAIAGVPA
jgi:signal transduction histidine kinase